MGGSATPLAHNSTPGQYAQALIATNNKHIPACNQHLVKTADDMSDADCRADCAQMYSADD
jgi:hypothetical protein